MSSTSKALKQFSLIYVYFLNANRKNPPDKPNTIKQTKTRLTGFSRYIFPLLEIIEIHFHTLFEMKFQFASMKGKG